MHCMSTKFGADSSSRFSLTVRTETHLVTDATDLPTCALTTADMGNDVKSKLKPLTTTWRNHPLTPSFDPKQDSGE